MRRYLILFMPNYIIFANFKKKLADLKKKFKPSFNISRKKEEKKKREKMGLIATLSVFFKYTWLTNFIFLI